MAEQLTFDLPARAATGRGDFFVSPTNAVAVATVEAWRDWPLGRLALTGPAGAGKTHLAHVWAAQAGARIVAARALAAADGAALAAAPVAVEDADRIARDDAAERALFHLVNRMGETRQPLLLTGTEAPARWGIALPDLASRLEAMPVAAIGGPDDALLAAVLVKQFSDRQIAVAPDVIRYLVDRIPRSFAAARQVVDRLDRAALREGRAITRRLAARLLDNGDAEGE